MIKISGLHLERENGLTFLIVTIQSDFCKTENKLWFNVDSAFEEYLTQDVYDAFLVAALFPAMFYGEDIEIKGCVSKRLYKNIMSDVQKIIQIAYPQMKMINIKVGGFKKAEKIKENIIGTGFSGGVDSFATIYDRFEKEEDPEYRLNTLFFFNLGQNGKYDDVRTKVHVQNLYRHEKGFADEKGMNFILMDSNLFAFYNPEWEYNAGVLCRVVGILVFERCVSKYYISSSYSYSSIINIGTYQRTSLLTGLTDPYILPLLSTEGTELIVDGEQYTRTEKTELIASYEPVLRYLNVCVNGDRGDTNAENCSVCDKCLRTLFALDVLNLLPNYASVFNLQKYKKLAFKYKCKQVLLYKTNPFAKDNVDFARFHNHQLPNYFRAWLTLFPENAILRVKIMILNFLKSIKFR